MTMPITKREVHEACKGTTLDLANSILYDMCRKHPEHKTDEIIWAKILIIGRVYAAAIERRKRVAERGDDFYIRNVIPRIKESDIDKWIQALPERIEDDVGGILCVHNDVTRLFNRIAGQDKRSLASKYLHFHRPDLFFIYDGRALTGVTIMTPRLRADLSEFDSGRRDKHYASFFLRCLTVRTLIRDEFREELTPRQLDNILIMLAERRNAPPQ